MTDIFLKHSLYEQFDVIKFQQFNPPVFEKS